MRPTLWATWCWPILSGRTRHVAAPVALVVGTILLAVNQGSQLLAREVDLVTVLRALANYAIPYVVSSIGYLKAPSGAPHPLGRKAGGRDSRNDGPDTARA
ncbi:nitrate/nitrite transporter NrtS [Nocardioides vastitatis]|uniref:Nitrate/nitrite transporter NrtS n=1 Tax=Nocardioides vastitatis TaxID=2568655 RepID=A0ABW0ZNQ9_9ACTN